MNYAVIEIQTNDNETVILPPRVYTDQDQAESQYHYVLASAAVSSVESHACMMITNDGALVKSECYNHAVESVE